MDPAGFDSAELDGDIAACRALIVEGSLEGPRPSDLAALRARVAADQANEVGLRARLRSLPTYQRWMIMVGAAAVVTVLSVVTTPRVDLAVYPTMRMVSTLVVLSLITAGALWRLLRPLHAPPPNVWISRLLLVVGVLTPCVFAVIPLHHVGASAGEGAAFASACGKCLGFGGALGLPVLVLAWLARRSRVDGAAVAALGGIAAGLTGNLTLQVHCPITETSHLLVGHASLLALLGVAAALWKR